MSSNGWAWADRRTRSRTGEAMRHRLSDLATPENIYTVQIGSAIGTHVGPGAPIGRLLGAGDLHMVSRAIPGSLAMAVPHGALHVMTLGRITAGINKEQAPAQRTANELHRCFAAGLADEA